MHRPNDLLRAARLALQSRTRPGRPLARAELAEMTNNEVWRATGRVTALCLGSIGHMERGQNRWPRPWTRAALRTVLGADTDAALGFHRPPPKQLPPRVGDLRTVTVTAGPGPTLVTVGGLSIAVKIIPARSRPAATTTGDNRSRRDSRLTAAGG